MTTMNSQSVLDAGIQEQFEQAIRDTIAEASRTDEKVLHEIPDPTLQEDLEIDDIPELAGITLESLIDQRQLSISVYFSSPPRGEVPLVPDYIAPNAEYTIPEGVDSSEITHLTELGGSYEQLSTQLMETLILYCDVPEATPERAFTGDRADLICTNLNDDGSVGFSADVTYPKYVEAIYAEGREDIAKRLRLPY